MRIEAEARERQLSELKQYRQGDTASQLIDSREKDADLNCNACVMAELCDQYKENNLCKLSESEYDMLDEEFWVNRSKPTPLSNQLTESEVVEWDAQPESAPRQLLSIR